MAGDWIKMRSNLWDDPRVARLCDLTDSAEAQIVGGLYWLWATADQHSADGHMSGLTLRSIDRKTGIQGLGDALVRIGWISEESDGVSITRFEEHNGSSAKRRSSDAQRKASVRKMSAPDADNKKTVAGVGVELEKEKRREELKTYGADAPADNPAVADVDGHRSPQCPHQEIIAAYHEILPMGTQVRVWNETRAKHLQTRWREDPKRQNLEWWRRFFGYVAESDFLTGQTQTANGRDPFVVSLDWLIAPQNFAKTVEGKYHRGAA